MPTERSARVNGSAGAAYAPSDEGVLTSDGLAGELQKLGWGRGLNAPAVEKRVGPMLTRAVRRDEHARTPDDAARTPNDPPHEVVDRAAVGRWLRQRLPGIPSDLAVAAQVFFGLHPQAQHRFLNERLDWLGERWGRDRRTVRRRVDEALALIAEAAIELVADGAAETRPPANAPTVALTAVPADTPPPALTGAQARTPGSSPAAGSPGRTGTGSSALTAVSTYGDLPEAPDGVSGRDSWYTERLSTLLRLDRDVPEATEQRTIVATADRVETVTLELSVPPDGGRGDHGRDLGVEILYGGILLGWDQPSASYFRLHVELPDPLRAGDRHELGIAVRLVDGAPMAPHYVCIPLARLTEFEIRIRFSRAQAAAGVEVFVLDGVPPRVVDDDTAQLPQLGVDRAGEVHMQFRDLRQGRGYGLSWVV